MSIPVPGDMPVGGFLDGGLPLEQPEEPQQLESLCIGAKVKLRSSMSMRFTDVLSNELNQALLEPQMMKVLQRYLHKPENIDTKALGPLMEHIPDPALNIVKEILFHSGSMLKWIHCEHVVNLSEPLVFRPSGLASEIEVLDGVVVAIRPLKHI